MEDSRIIELYWKREEHAILETSRRYGAYCFAVADHILSNVQDSEECVNDTWLRAWNSMPPQRPNQLRLFLAKITRNLSFDKFKARSAGKRGSGETAVALDELEECLPSSSSVEAEIAAKELEDCVNRFLHALPERECNVFLRRYFYVESAAEIAEAYGLKESNVWMILSRTRKKLRSFLEKEDYAI